MKFNAIVVFLILLCCFSCMTGGREEPGNTIFSREEIQEQKLFKKISSLSYDGLLPVSDNEKILSVSEDIDEDKKNEIFILYVKLSDRMKRQVSYLSNTKRLYSSKQESFDFYLKVFRDGKKLIEVKNIFLGNYILFRNMNGIKINSFSASPFCIETEFRNSKNTEKKWNVFKSDFTGFAFTIEDHVSKKTIIDDIDNDGVLDLIQYENSIEEGSGEETYITWFKWSDNGYAEHKNISIVRNLNKFLQYSGELLAQKKFDIFLSKAMDPEDLKKIQENEIKPADIINMLFDPVESEDNKARKNFLMDNERIINVVFPEINENPFSIRSTNDFCPLSLKLITDKGTYLFNARLKMYKNPFLSGQFFFITD